MLSLNGVELIAAERERQVTAEGWTPEHDDEHTEGEIAVAAALYALPEPERSELPRHEANWGGDGSPLMWPWDGYWKPTPGDRVRELVKAGALIAAEIDRLSRASSRSRPLVDAASSPQREAPDVGNESAPGAESNQKETT